MFLGAYHFDGDAAELLPAYHRLVVSFPPGAIALQLCTVTERGLTVFDTCPSREAFTEFSTGESFRAAVAMAGLPKARVKAIGELHHTVVGEAVSR